MTEDARFEDARETPLNLGAFDSDDLAVISSLAQDAVFPGAEMAWDAAAGRFAVLLNRFRWEDARTHAEPERVQSLLVFANVEAVASTGIDRKDADTVHALLAIGFEPTDTPRGQVTLTLAGGGAVRLTVEALEVTLKDVTRPYLAPTGKAPRHPE